MYEFCRSRVQFSECIKKSKRAFWDDEGFISRLIPPPFKWPVKLHWFPSYLLSRDFHNL